MTNGFDRIPSFEDQIRAPIPPVRQVLVNDHYDALSSIGPRARSAGPSNSGVFGGRTAMRDFRSEASKS